MLTKKDNIYNVFKSKQGCIEHPCKPLVPIMLKLTCLSSLFDRNGCRNGHTNHRVVACADKTHHLNVCGNRRRTCKLSVAVHTAHSICHTVGSRTCSHVIGMKCTACAAARCNREVLLACFKAFPTFLCGLYLIS